MSLLSRRRVPAAPALAERDSMPPEFALSARGIVKKGDQGEPILRGVDIDVKKGQLTVIRGESGSGKTSLLHCLAALDHPDRGSITFGNINVAALSHENRTAWRGAHLGLIAQQPDLLDGSVIHNILTPHMLEGRNIDPEWAGYFVGRLGIGGEDFLSRSAAQLSGGQKQRVAIARALVHQPEVIFADEPTSALDVTRTEEVHELLRSLVDEAGITVVMVSHDPLSEQFADAVHSMEDGQIV